MFAGQMWAGPEERGMRQAHGRPCHPSETLVLHLGQQDLGHGRGWGDGCRSAA